MDRSLSDSYVADAYDELLSQGEIQGHLTKVKDLGFSSQSKNSFFNRLHS